MQNDLTNGYYWLKNISDEKEKAIYRPIRVTIVTESGYHFGHNWYTPGTYFQWIGDDRVYTLNYLDGPWKGVEFIKLEEPQHLG